MKKPSKDGLFWNPDYPEFLYCIYSVFEKIDVDVVLILSNIPEEEFIIVNPLSRVAKNQWEWRITNWKPEELLNPSDTKFEYIGTIK